MKIYYLYKEFVWTFSVTHMFCILMFPTTTSPTKTHMAAPTTTEAPALGVDCSNKTNGSDWCNATITGEAICNNDSICSCASHYFNESNTVCILETNLIPINLQTSAVTTNSFDITWSQKDSVKDIPLSYTVQAKPAYTYVGSGLDEVNCTLETGQMKASCEGLGSGYRYNVTVSTSYNSEFKGFFGMIQESTVPNTPGSFNTSVSSINAFNVSLVWTPSQSKVDFYNVKVIQFDTNDIVKNQSTSNNRPKIYISDLTPWTNYTVNITAYSYGKSSAVSVGTFRTGIAVPGPPGQPELVSVTMNSIKMKWTVTDQPNGDIKGHQVCIKYKFYIDQSYTDLECENTKDGSILEYEKTGLYAGTHYQFDVYTTNDMYNSTISSSLQQRTHESFPGKVSELYAIPNDTNINVTWQRPSRPNGDIIAYQVQWIRVLDQQNCIVYLKTQENFLLETKPCSHNISEPDSIAKNEEHMNYLIINLKTSTEYVIEVRAFTYGLGEVSNKTIYTNVSVPDSVTDVIADVLNATAVNVTWTIPGSNPGPVTYTVTSQNMVVNSTVQQSCSVQDYTSSSCVVPGLHEYWVYRFSVVAETAAGLSTPILSDSITTKEAAPGLISVYNFELFNKTENCDATKVTITWFEPELPERNSLIKQYRFYVDGIHKLTYDVKEPKPYSVNNRKFTQTFQDLQADTSHTWKVIAVSSESTPGAEKRFDIIQGVCAPPPWTETSIESIKETISTPSTVTIQIQSTFFQNTQQGKIAEKGLIVLPRNSNFYEETSSINYSELKAWAAARSLQFEREYKIIILEAVTDQFMIGKDIECETTETAVNFCNGPLPEQFSFKMAAFVCTRSLMNFLCTISRPFGPFTTKKTSVLASDARADTTATVTVAVVLGIIVVLLATSTIFLTLKLRKIRKYKGVSNNYQQSRGQPIYMNQAVAITAQETRDSEVARSTDNVENQYASLDENCRDEARTVYSVLQIN